MNTWCINTQSLTYLISEKNSYLKCNLIYNKECYKLEIMFSIVIDYIL